MAFNKDNLRIMTGNANPALAKDIAAFLDVSLSNVIVGHFNNGEIQVMIEESIRGKDIYIIQPTSQPVNDNLMELLIMVDACRRASAKSVTAVVPYYAYARQDRKTRGREPISAKLVANLLETAGCDRVITVDLHAGQIQGFFDIPVDHIAAAPVIAKYLKGQNYPDVVVVSPDLGGVTRARILADYLRAPIAIIEKRRPKPGVAEVMNLIGEVQGKTAIIIDDIVDSAGSLIEGTKALVDLKVKRVLACCSHAILSGPAKERIESSPLEKLVVTDTIALPEDKKSDKIVVLSMAEPIAEVIQCIQAHESVSKLFEKRK